MKKYLMAISIWIMSIPFAILNGGFREYMNVPVPDLVSFIRTAL